MIVLPEGDPIPSAFRELAAAERAAPALPAFAPTWFLERAPTVLPLRERLSPSESEPVGGVAVGEIIEVGPRISVHGDDMARIGAALHAVMAAEFVNPGRDDAVECAAALIATVAGDGVVAPTDAVGCARRLRATLNARFAAGRMLVEHPVELVQDNGQVLRGWIDLAIETEAGWIVVDHKSSPRPRSEWAAEAIEYSGQLAAYACALRRSGLQCAGCWLHLPVGGGLVEVLVDSPGDLVRQSDSTSRIVADRLDSAG